MAQIGGIHYLLPATTMEDDKDKEFVHSIAIKLSRVMNNPIPNDLLAQNVIAMAKSKSNDTAGFIKGNTNFSQQVKIMLKLFYSAASTFGKFQDKFLGELQEVILAYTQQDSAQSEQIQGFSVTDMDVLAPEPVRTGGLVRPGLVCSTALEISTAKCLYISYANSYLSATHVSCSSEARSTSNTKSLIAWA